MTDSAARASTQMPPSADRIAAISAKLRSLTQLSVQPQWRSRLGDLPAAVATQPSQWASWTPVALNAKQQITWAKGRQVLWLGQRLVVPHNLQGYPLQGLTLRLSLQWWAAIAQIYVNGRLVQEGDLFDATTRILLSPAVMPHQAIDVAIRLESPGHDNGALVRSLCVYEFADQAMSPCPEPGFVADELAVLRDYLLAFDPARLETVAGAAAQLPWSVLAVCDRLSFDRGLVQLRQQLQPLSQWIKQRQIQLVGHAHLDMAWLWPIAETWQVAERTFRSVLALMQEFPELTFCHTSPALYAWFEQNRPDLFAQIRAQVAAGRWEVEVGPMWIEPELQISGGESIARQLLYGQRYLQRAFGKRGTTAWLADTFGFNAQLPQFLQQGGVEFFATQKLRWNDTTQFPHEAHVWQAPNGSQRFSLQTAPIGEGIEPVKMAQYACKWETSTKTQRCLWLPGVGDHGGGPTRDMLMLARRWQQSPFFPRLEFSTMSGFLRQLASSKPAGTQFPVWRDELYLELHRGCYTNHADQKQFNRRGEDLLYEAELLASLRSIATGAPYPQEELEAAWKKLLFNQFHDILPGTAIGAVYADANPEWQAAIDQAWNLRQQSMQDLIRQMKLPPAPHPQAKLVTVFNPLGWARSELVTISVTQSQEARSCVWQICDLAGRELPSQPHCWREGNVTQCQIFFSASVPAIGYSCFWLMPRSTGNPVPAVSASNFVLENDRLRATIDPTTGNLASLYDKTHRRDLLSRPGNELQAFRDSGQYWDAWDIAPNYAQHPLPSATLSQIFYEDQGSLLTRIRVVRRLGQSTFNQVYSLAKAAAVLKIETIADWQERQTVVKAAFSFNINASVATYEIPGGAIERSTRPQTPAEQAKWEVPALRWADLSDSASQNSYGVSLLSDCKHGYDSRPDRLRLTLLRGSNWPDPQSDRGSHHFTYALYAHDRSWQAAQTPRRAYELNQPLLPVVTAPPRSPGNLPPTGSFLELPSNLMLMALKRSEADPQRWVLRCHEAQGAAATLSLPASSLIGQWLDRTSLQPANGLEEPIAAESPTRTLAIAPWQMVTVLLRPVS